MHLRIRGTSGSLHKGNLCSACPHHLYQSSQHGPYTYLIGEKGGQGNSCKPSIGYIISSSIYESCRSISDSIYESCRSISDSIHESCRNISLWVVLPYFSSPDSKAQSRCIQLGHIGYGMLHKMYMPAVGSKRTINEVTH